MPLLSPSQIHEVLKPLNPQTNDPKSLEALLNKTGLSREEVLENVATIMRLGETDNVKLQAAKLGAQFNGMLEDNETNKNMHVTIVINDSQFNSVNPILIPRN